MANTVSRTVSDATLNKIIQIESAGRPRAKATTSTATGLFQFINSTWLKTIEKHRPDLMEGRTRKQILDLRFDPALSIELGARLTEESVKALGAGASDGDIYLAHFAGVATAKKLMRSHPDAAAETIFSPAQIKANRQILAGKTAAEIRAWAKSKMARAGKTDWIAKYYRKTPIVPGEAVEADAAPHGKIASEILEVQQRLKALGYFEVGQEDGKWGGRTRGAIAAFKNDRHMPGVAAIDDELISELRAAEFEGWKRPIAKERKEATAAKVEKETGVIVPQKTGTISSAITAVGGFIVWAFNSVIGMFGDIWNSDLVSAVREFTSDNLGWIAFAVAVVGGLTLYKTWQDQKAQQAKIVDAYQEGRLS